MKTRTKLLAGFNASILLGAALVLLAGTAPASAHTPEVDPTCTGVTVTLENYSHSADDSTPNGVIVTIDDIEVANEEFGASFAGQFDFADTTIGHEYTVTIDALDNGYDRSFDGTTDACVAPPLPADAAAAVHVTTPTCDVPARLELGEAVNASWSSPTAMTGPAAYSVVATADVGHTFPDGETTVTFAGHLAGQLDSVEAGCATSPGTVPSKPEPVVTSTSVDDANCDTDSITTTTTTVSTGWAYDSDSNTWLPTAPVTTVTTADREAAQKDCPTPVGVKSAATELPTTGADSGWLLGVAGGLLAAGAALVLVRRTRRA